ncbi:zinc finger, CCHC-type containing protein [Tanacetum coccineum]
MASNIKNFKCLIHFNETQRGFILSQDLTCSMLHEMVMQKFKLEANAVINVSFKLSSFDFAVDITDDAEAMKGKHYGIQQVRGSPYEAFEMLQYYCYNLEKNEGIVTRIKTDDNEVVEMLFIAIGASGLYKGTNLVDVAMDGNNQIVPIAFGICKGETSPCWHAAIALAVEKEFPLAFHAAYTREDYATNMNTLQIVQPDAHEKLSNMTYEITDWAANKVAKKGMKSATWVVKGVNAYQYEVSDAQYKLEIYIDHIGVNFVIHKYIFPNASLAEMMNHVITDYSSENEGIIRQETQNDYTSDQMVEWAEQEHIEYEETKVSCPKIDQSSMLIHNNRSKEESFGGDADREVLVNETFHEQKNDELTEKELKQVEADDQVMGLDSLDLDSENRERKRLRLFQFSLRDQASNWLERLPAGSITTWEDLTTRFLAQSFPPGRTAKLCNDILLFQQHHGESLSEAWTRFKDLLQKVPHHGIDHWLQVQFFYDHVNPVTRRTIDQSSTGKLHDRNAKESWALLEDIALYDNES